MERAIRYILDAFFAGRTFADLDDLNAQAELWVGGPAAQRRCPEDPTLSVGEAFAQEQPRLLTLPEHPYPTDEQLAVVAGKTPYIRFDLNDYSIPPTHVRRTLTVVASPQQVRILDGVHLLACHRRSHERGAQIEDAAHIETLVAHKRAARHHRATDRLAHAAPASAQLLVRAAERGESLGTITATLMRLLEHYGATELQAAIEEALGRGVPHPNAVRLALERRREARRLPPPLPVRLPEHVRSRDILVAPQRLDPYDQLTADNDDEPS